GVRSIFKACRGGGRYALKSGFGAMFIGFGTVARIGKRSVKPRQALPKTVRNREFDKVSDKVSDKVLVLTTKGQGQGVFYPQVRKGPMMTGFFEDFIRKPLVNIG